MLEIVKLKTNKVVCLIFALKAPLMNPVLKKNYHVFRLYFLRFNLNLIVIKPLLK
jgi:hypothetical protein